MSQYFKILVHIVDISPQKFNKNRCICKIIKKFILCINIIFFSLIVSKYFKIKKNSNVLFEISISTLQSNQNSIFTDDI